MGCQGRFVYIIRPDVYRKYYKAGIYKFLPEWLLIRIVNYIKPKILCRYNLVGSSEVKGYGVGITLSYGSITKEDMVDRIIKAITYLANENITEIYLDDIDLFGIEDIQKIENRSGAKVTNGKDIKIQLVWYIIKEICKYNNIELKEQEILIVGDETDYTERIVWNIANDIKYLSVLCNDSKSINELANQVFLKTGLSIHVTENIKTNLSKYNIIINLRNNIKLEINDIKKKTMVFDLSCNNEFGKKIRNIRKDIMVVRDFIFKRREIIKCDVEYCKFDNEIPSHIYQIAGEINKEDFIKIVMDRKKYTIKEISELFLKDSFSCRNIAINAINKSTLDS